MSIELTYSKLSGFGPGAMITTTDGELPVEWLEPGDCVLTRDRGPQPILAIKRSRGVGPDGRPLLPPIHLRPADKSAPHGLQGALRLSPHHKVLVQADREEAIADIAALSRRRGPRPDPGAPALTYHHILTAHHDLILTCGIWVETTGPATARLLDLPHAIARNCAVMDPDCPPPRPCMTWPQARALRDRLNPDLSLLHLLAA